MTRSWGKRDGAPSDDAEAPPPVLGTSMLDTMVSGVELGESLPGADLQIGELLRDTYRVIGHLASGGTGNVFLAAHERLPGNVAVKTLQGERLADAQSLARFRAEAEITASLRHPHIVQVLDFDVTASGVPYLVMELLDGHDLCSVVGAGPCPMPRVLNIVRQVVSALQFAHGKGVVHRDLKPANVMLVDIEGESDFVKVVDFGLSKLLTAQGPPVTRPDQILGTPGYMAPEQVRGGRVDPRVDQYALASLVYELLSCRPPFPGTDLSTVLHAVINDEAPALSSLVKIPARALSLVLARGLAKSPEARHESLAAFETALRAAVEEDNPGVVDKVVPPVEDDSPDLLEIGRGYRW